MRRVLLHPPFETMTLVFGVICVELLLGHHTMGKGYDDQVGKVEASVDGHLSMMLPNYLDCWRCTDLISDL